MTLLIADNSPIYLGITPAGSEWFYYPKGNDQDQARLENMFTAFCRLWRKHDERVGTTYLLSITSANRETFSAPLADATKMMLKYEDIRREGGNPVMRLTTPYQVARKTIKVTIADSRRFYGLTYLQDDSDWTKLPKHVRNIIKRADENKIEARNWNS